MFTFENISQAIIMIVVMVCPMMRAQTNPAWLRTAFLVSLSIQPLYLWTTWEHGQWGMFIATIWYTLWQVKGYLNWRHK